MTIIGPNSEFKPQIWAVGGGKGGVGKSFVSSNMGVSLALQGKKVVLVDLDLGGANLHTYLGGRQPRETLSDFTNGRVNSLESLLVDTEIGNLKFISGAGDALDAPQLSQEPKKQLTEALLGLKCDYLILDLGAGSSEYTLDFFLLADVPLITLQPEPTSIENGYRFIKAAFYRKIRSVENRLGLQKVIDEAMDHKNTLGIRTPYDLVNYLTRVEPSKGHELSAFLSRFKMYLIMNQVRARIDTEIGDQTVSVVKKYFGLDLNYVGYLDYDNAAWQAVRKKRPLFLQFPYSHLVTQFRQITNTLSGRKPNRVVSFVS